MRTNNKFPLHGWIGIALVIIFWYLNWNLEGLRTQILFFPLWFGYALTVDAMVYLRKGSSLLQRDIKKYISLFLISAPAWWLFELLNLRTQNWIYDGKQFFSELEYALYATLSFSTVIPAVFGTAELAGTFNWIKKFQNGIKINPTKNYLITHLTVGCIMLSLVMIWPKIFFALIWLSVFLILEPFNVWFGKRSIYQQLSNGDWREVISLVAGCLICGFFWEMWNYFSYPKWIYDIHFVNFLHIFEMPVLGYLGYILFSLELFTIYHLVTEEKNNYIRIIND